MSPKLWREIERHYLALQGRPATERQQYLAQCAPEVRDHVEKMLDQPSGDSLLPHLPDDAAATTTISSVLKSGFQFGPYRVDGLLGTGGMGAVYRGVDTRLDRPVAIKVSKEEFSRRFEREAKAIAALNHPNICTLFDIGPNYLVMELIEGKSLAETLAGAPLPREAVIRYGSQLANALSAAHAKGIIHRDLKPQNIMLADGGGAPVAKLLDFGIAKAAEAAPADQFVTGTAVRIGTPAYMAPEQLEAGPVDARTDLYALGLVLQEMIRGRNTGTSRPVDVPLSAIIEKCLRRNPAERYQSASEVQAALNHAVAIAAPQATPVTRRNALWLPLGAAASVLGGGAFWWNRRSAGGGASAAPIHAFIPLPRNAAGADPGRLQGPPVIAPDGSSVAVSLVNESGNAIYRRPLDSDQLTLVEGTSGGTYPFWSPDSREIAFFADDKLKRVSAVGGSVITLCKAIDPRGGAWSSSGVIIFGLNGKGLFRVGAAGGEVRPLTQLDPSTGENSHRYPVFLEGRGGERRFFYFARADRLENRAIFVSSLDRPAERHRVALADGQFAVARDRPDGTLYLLTQQSTKTVIQPLDAASLTVTGSPSVLLQHAGQVSVSDSGVLAIRAQSDDRSRLVWRDRDGKEAGSIGKPEDYWELALSPDDRYAAVVKHNVLSGEFRVWLASLPAALLEPFTEETHVGEIAWMRNGTVLFGFDSRSQQLLRLGVSPRGDRFERKVEPAGIQLSGLSVAPDGKTLLAGLISDGPSPFLAWTTVDQGRWNKIGSPAIEGGEPSFSPDGKWVAFESKATGHSEIDIVDFPDAGRRYRVSREGGSHPRWRGDGRELYFIGGGAMMSVPISASGEPSTSPPEKRFEAIFRRDKAGRIYDVSKDGNRFLVSEDANASSQSNIELIFNWSGLLARHG
ncbi:MAG TPA: protein kinase [Bryobacteraceae bacterium]|nr:protein kinase [Bryobacteraceae bacterium]